MLQRGSTTPPNDVKNKVYYREILSLGWMVGLALRADRTVRRAVPTGLRDYTTD